MWPAKPKPDPELLELFEESARNVQRAALLLRDLLADYPEPAALGARDPARASTRATGSPTTSSTGSPSTGHRRAALDAADVHALAGALDDIVDFAEEAADQLGLYGVEAPMEQAQEIADVLVGAPSRSPPRCAGCATAPTLAPHLVEIHRLENEADRLQRDAVASLFANGIDPMVRDPLEGHLRAARGGGRRVRDGRQRARGHRDQAARR